MATYIVNGQRIYAREEGPKKAQIALLIHGWSSSWFALSPLLPLLSKRFACIAVDLPGYGKSSPLPHRPTISDYADLLAALIQDVTDQPVVLVGHSMGGMISLTLALRYPVLVERMVLLAPAISGHLSFFINSVVAPITLLERSPLANRLIARLEPHLVSVTDRLMRPASFAERSEITERDYLRIRADARRPGQGRVRAECFWAMRANDLRGKLHRMETSALVLWGAEDNTVPLRDAGIVADEWRTADLRIIPGAGHWPQFEEPEKTRRHVAAFLGLPQEPPPGEPWTSASAPTIDQAAQAAVQAARINRVAQFLALSDVGNDMNLVQRQQLARLCSIEHYLPGTIIAAPDEPCTDLYIVQQGTIDVWIDMAPLPARLLATLPPGRITGELALLDGGRRSASLRAGPEGAAVLILRREQVAALCEEDAPLGNRLLWNIATALALRLRQATWQLLLADQEQIASQRSARQRA